MLARLPVRQPVAQPAAARTAGGEEGAVGRSRKGARGESEEKCGYR